MTLRKGIDISRLRARRLRSEDYDFYDVILAAEQANVDFINSECKRKNMYKINQLLAYAPDTGCLEIPDPYGEGMQEFEYVYDLISQACEGLLQELKRRISSERDK